MKLTKLLAIGALLVMSCGCGKQPSEPQKVNVLVPQGAPALATLSIYDNEYADVTTVAGSDPLTAELAKSDSEYDVIIAPINLGVAMMAKDSTDYRLTAVITWGNLYIAATDTYQVGDPFAAFGENAVPGKVLSQYEDWQNVTYYNSVQDVQAQLLSGKVQAGLLAEPALSATLAKANEQGFTLSVVKDLQEEESSNGQKGYPQAAVFVKAGSEEKVQSALAEMKTFLNETASDREKVTALIEAVGVDNLGVPSANIAVASWERQNLTYVDASDAITEITQFLNLFDLSFQETMLSQ